MVCHLIPSYGLLIDTGDALPLFRGAEHQRTDRVCAGVEEGLRERTSTRIAEAENLRTSFIAEGFMAEGVITGGPGATR